MNLRHILLTALVLIGPDICFGQEDLSRHQPTVIPHRPAKSAIYVLKVDNKSLVLMPGQNEDITLKSFDADWIQSISIQKGKNMIDIYGKDARNGVVIITFRDFKIIPRELQDKFRESE